MYQCVILSSSPAAAILIKVPVPFIAAVSERMVIVFEDDNIIVSAKRAKIARNVSQK